MNSTPGRGGRLRGLLSGESVIPAAALLLLPALAAGLTYHAAAADRSHRRAAESALRDYAAFAAWQLDRHAHEHLEADLWSSVYRAHELRLAAGDALPPASLLTPDTGGCSCGFKQDYQFAFRLELPGGTVTTDRPVSASVRAGLARRFAGAPAAIPARVPADSARVAPAWARMTVDSIGGALHALAYTVVREPGPGAAPRAVYGVAGDPRHLTHAVEKIMREQSLLPPSLVGRGVPNDSVLLVRVTAPDGRLIYETPTPLGAASFTAADSLDPRLGGFVTTVAVRPERAPSLVIGGLPPSRLPVLVALVATAALLAGAALVQLRRARELARMRGHFVANVSHELRTPLTQISMFSETLLLGRERSATERQHFLSVILREARRLTTLVDSVLRFSRSEAVAGAAGGRVPGALRPEPLDVADHVREALHAFVPLAEAAGASVRPELDAGAVATADAGALRQVVLNLLDNAVKYGPPEQTVVVRVARDAGAEVDVSVADGGPGIPAADRQRVFEPFVRLDRPGAPRVSGTGIGLAVVRDLVLAQGGRVWIDDAWPDRPAGHRGTRVTFTLPAASTPASFAVETETATALLAADERG